MAVGAQGGEMIDPAFGHWLAGFIDGEGSFVIARSGRDVGDGAPVSFKLQFYLGLRADDEDILREIQRRTAIGRVGYRAAVGGRNTAAQYAWMVRSRRDCGKLIRLLDRYPLRAKKARDFAVWREAYRVWCQIGGARAGQRGVADWPRLAALQSELKATRLLRPEPAQASGPPLVPALFSDEAAGLERSGP